MKLPKLINQVTSCIQIWRQGFNLALFFLFFFFVLVINEYSYEESSKKKKEMHLSPCTLRDKKIPFALSIETKCNDNFLIESKQLSCLKMLFPEQVYKNKHIN